MLNALRELIDLEIDRITDAQSALKTAINAAGGTLTDETLEYFSYAFAAIVTGEPQPIEFDVDGTVITLETARLIDAKAALKTAINAAGGELTNETLEDYAAEAARVLALNAEPGAPEDTEEIITLTADAIINLILLTYKQGYDQEKITLTANATIDFIYIG